MNQLKSELVHIIYAHLIHPLYYSVVTNRNAPNKKHKLLIINVIFNCIFFNQASKLP